MFGNFSWLGMKGLERLYLQRTVIQHCEQALTDLLNAKTTIM